MIIVMAYGYAKRAGQSDADLNARPIALARFPEVHATDGFGVRG